MKHGGDIVETNKRGPMPTPAPKKHFHIDTDKLRGLTGKPSKQKKQKKSKHSKRKKNSRKYRNVPRWEDDYYYDNDPGKFKKLDPRRAELAGKNCFKGNIN